MKKLLAILAAIALTGCLFGCSGAPETVTLDPDALVSELQSKITFVEEPFQLSENKIGNYYELPEEGILSADVYVAGVGATPEEIAIFQCADAATANAVKAACETRIAEQKEAFVDYVPAEMPKLEDPVIVVKGNWVVMVISGDDATAEQVILSNMK
ncbi:MAG: DUF4358 domain-containing protein [Ruminococcaceae bacterium]|nr:DUF4358 domain-containing protein [Oscillospiraceae bacterium]